MKVAFLIAFHFLGFAVLALPSSGTDEFPVPVNSEKATSAPMPPDEVVKSVKLPPGFKLQVFAAEPDVQNPIAITTDERGRLWVAENYSWAGGGAGGFDGSQRDRIVVLEDTNGDGQHDKRTVFWDRARKLTSVEVGFGGVWAICLPHLLFIPDKDHDDVPDSEPVVVLDGFDEGAVGHTPANGLKWGLDGWLYGRHGIQATSGIGKPGATQSQRTNINTGVWRYQVSSGIVEDVLHGMTNSWGTDYDQNGEMFVINTVIGHLWHTVPGARVKRMYGVDMNPHAYQLIDQVADHVHWDTGENWNDVDKGVSDKTSAAGGGHAHIGMMIYQGDNWPAEYRGRVYTLNLHGRRINSDILERENAGYTAKHGPDMCFMADTWYRGMDLITGPDGGVFIADWSDTGECHDHDGVHRTSGRIYKLTYGQPKPVEPFDLSQSTMNQLVQYQLHENDWWARQSRRMLQERAALNNAAADGLADAQHELEALLLKQVETPIRIRLVAAMNAVNAASEPWLVDKLFAAEEHEKVLALRLLSDRWAVNGEAPSEALLQKLQTMAQSESSGLVCLYLASTLQRLPVDARWPIVDALAAKKEFASDRMFPIMLWLGVEPAVPRRPARAIALAQKSQIPLLTQNVSRRLTLEIERDPKTVESLLNLAIVNKAIYSEEIIHGIAMALEGWRKAPAPANWTAVTNRFGKSAEAELKNDLQKLSIIFGDGVAVEQLRSLIVDGSQEPEARRQALRALLASRPLDYAPTLQQLIQDRALVSDAIRGLAQYDHNDTPARILESIARFDSQTRSEAINTMVSRPAYAKELLNALREKKLSPGDISAFHARQIASFENPELAAQLTELWGDVRVSAAEKVAQVEQLKTQLTADSLAQADLSSGRLTFQKTCSNCHVLFGAGRTVGPDLTGSNRKNIDYLLENMIDPSASVGADFRVMQLTMTDGRVISGVVTQQSERTITLQSPQEPITVDRNEIEASKQSPNSIMPEGQLQNLNPDQIRDLVGYLMSSNQVPLPVAN